MTNREDKEADDMLIPLLFPFTLQHSEKSEIHTRKSAISKNIMIDSILLIVISTIIAVFSNYAWTCDDSLKLPIWVLCFSSDIALFALGTVTVRDAITNLKSKGYDSGGFKVDSECRIIKIDGNTEFELPKWYSQLRRTYTTDHSIGLSIAVILQYYPEWYSEFPPLRLLTSDETIRQRVKLYLLKQDRMAYLTKAYQVLTDTECNEVFLRDKTVNAKMTAMGNELSKLITDTIHTLEKQRKAEKEAYVQAKIGAYMNCNFGDVVGIGAKDAAKAVNDALKNASRDNTFSSAIKHDKEEIVDVKGNRIIPSIDHAIVQHPSPWPFSVSIECATNTYIFMSPDHKQKLETTPELAETYCWDGTTFRKRDSKLYESSDVSNVVEDSELAKHAEKFRSRIYQSGAMTPNEVREMALDNFLNSDNDRNTETKDKKPITTVVYGNVSCDLEMYKNCETATLANGMTVNVPRPLGNNNRLVDVRGDSMMITNGNRTSYYQYRNGAMALMWTSTPKGREQLDKK